MGEGEEGEVGEWTTTETSSRSTDSSGSPLSRKSWYSVGVDGGGVRRCGGVGISDRWLGMSIVVVVVGVVVGVLLSSLCRLLQ